MGRVDPRAVALKHLMESWEYILECIQEKKANRSDPTYKYNSELFLKAWCMIESFDNAQAIEEDD